MPVNVPKFCDRSELETNLFYTLPETLKQKQMPVSTNNIVTEEVLRKWPYQSRVHIPSLKLNTDLLIESNAPTLLEPWDRYIGLNLPSGDVVVR